MKYVIMVFLALYLLPVSAHAQPVTVGGGDVTFKPKGAAPVTFSHKVHVSIKGLKCSACHYHIFPMAKDPKKMGMNNIKKGKFCGKCHNGVKAFDVNDAKNCTKCHK